MAKDTYNNYKELKRNEKINEDYKISIFDAGSPITIIAPHGGSVEPQTSRIAADIARDQFNYYCFEGIKPSNNRSLHITSHNFDEPQALQLLARSQIVVAVHACTDDRALVYPGGRNEKLMETIVKELKAVGISVVDRKFKYLGLNPNNICNRGASGKGAQLEISRGLRDDINKVQTLCDSIHTVLANLAVKKYS